MRRKFTLLSLAIVPCSLSFAQIKYGFKIGATQSFVKEDWQEPGTKNSLKTGFQVGAMVEAPVLKNLSLRPALQLTQKGYKAVVGNEAGPFYWNRNLSATYLELPVNLAYNVPVDKATKIFIGTGPVLGFGLFGKRKSSFAATDNDQKLHTQSSTSNQIFHNQTDRRFDLGWDFLMGLQYQKIIVSADYNHGLSNITRENHIKNRTIALTIGYFINN